VGEAASTRERNWLRSSSRKLARLRSPLLTSARGVLENVQAFQTSMRARIEEATS
jgi:hypothetical protein